VNEIRRQERPFLRRRASPSSGAGKPILPVCSALAAPVSPKGPTPAELLKAKYERNKANLKTAWK